jgi:hypothetical protein
MHRLKGCSLTFVCPIGSCMTMSIDASACTRNPQNEFRESTFRRTSARLRHTCAVSGNTGRSLLL